MTSARLTQAQLAKFKASQLPVKLSWQSRLLKLKPATLALMIQISALLAWSLGTQLDALFGLNLLVWLKSSDMPLMLWAMLTQSAFALGFSRYLGMPSWWQWIHALFPLAVFTMLQMAIPTHIYFIGFIVTLALYWSVHRTQVPFYPSFPATWRAVLALMQKQALLAQKTSLINSIRVIDIGSGLGDLPMYLAKHRPQDQVLGIEIAPLPYIISVCRTWLTRSRAEMLLGDYHQHHFFQFDMVFAYLSPAAMPALWQKAKHEMRKGSVLVSSEFPVPNVRATEIIKPSDTAPALYLYRI